MPIDSISYQTNAPYTGGRRAYPLASIDLLKYFGAAGRGTGVYLRSRRSGTRLQQWQHTPAAQSPGIENFPDERRVASSGGADLPSSVWNGEDNGFICIIEEGSLARIRADVAVE